MSQNKHFNLNYSYDNDSDSIFINVVNEYVQDDLKKIDRPTLLIWGGLDVDTPIEQGRKMEKLIPDAGLVEYPYGSHFAYLENIQNVNVVLNEFLKDLK